MNANKERARIKMGFFNLAGTDPEAEFCRIKQDKADEGPSLVFHKSSLKGRKSSTEVM